MSSPFQAFRLRGTVVHGFGRGGSQLGYPTANIDIDDDTVAKLQPYKGLVICGFGCIERVDPSRDGTTAAHTENGPFPFAMSVGHNPQFKNKDLSAEVYFLHKFEQDFYGSVVRIVALEPIRTQSAFKSLEELIAAIDDDVVNTKRSLARPELAAYETDRFADPSAALPEAEKHLPFFALV